MMDDKVPELEIEQSEVEPLELPEGRRKTETGDQQDFGKDPKTGKTPGAESEEPEIPKNDSGKFPRATEKRSRREEQKKLKEQKQQHHKMMQEMRKPVRHGDLMQVMQQIQQFIVMPHVRKLQEAVDKLSLLPDYIGNCVNDSGVFDIEPNLESFEEYYEKYMERLEKEEAEAAAEKKQDEECSCESGCEKCTPDPKDTPATEEAQTE